MTNNSRRIRPLCKKKQLKFKDKPNYPSSSKMYSKLTKNHHTNSLTLRFSISSALPAAINTKTSSTSTTIPLHNDNKIKWSHSYGRTSKQMRPKILFCNFPSPPCSTLKKCIITANGRWFTTVGDIVSYGSVRIEKDTTSTIDERYHALPSIRISRLFAVVRLVKIAPLSIFGRHRIKLP